MVHYLFYHTLTALPLGVGRPTKGAPMKLSDDLHVIVLPMQMGEHVSPINLSVILDATQGPTLVDTGMPGQLDTLAAALAETAIQLHDIKRIILTHHDIDHVGSLHDLVRATGA